MDGDEEVIYQLRLPGGKHYVGRTSRPQRRLQEHRLQPGPWVQRHGAPEALFVAEHVTQRARAGTQEEAVVAQLMWVCGVNAVRGGSRLGPQDYTIADVPELTRFLGTHLSMDLNLVKARLLASDDLQPIALCLGCGGATLRNRPRCLRCFTAASFCRGCGARGHLQRDCTAHQLDGEVGRSSQPERETAACSMCRGEAEPGGRALCRGCFLACSACFDCGLCGHQEGDAACCVRQRADGSGDAQQPESDDSQLRSPPPRRRKRFRELRPRYAHLGVGWCWTCGRRGHMAGECGEAVDVDNRAIEDWDDCDGPGSQQ